MVVLSTCNFHRLKTIKLVTQCNETLKACMKLNNQKYFCKAANVIVSFVSC